MEKILCFKCGTKPHTTAEEFMAMITVETYGETGSNKRHASEDVAQNFENFVFDCEGKQNRKKMIWT